MNTVTLDRRALVVDDEPMQRIILSRMLRGAGVATDCAGNVREARAFLVDTDYDLLLLDLSLRDEDSLVLLHQLNELRRSPVILFVSGMDNRIRTASGRVASDLGLTVAGTLSKPIEADALHVLLAPLPVRRHHDTNRRRALPTEAELSAALDSGSIQVHYQPKVALRNRAVIGVEALARWDSPRHGAVSPEVFVPLAERSGLIDHLTEHVLAQALASCVRFRRWVPDCTVAVNLSPVSLRGSHMPVLIEDALRTHQLPPGSLVVELTEGCALDNTVLATEILTRLRIRGIALSIDDFGTGHSSLQSLMRLPFCELKIDKSFIRELAHDDDAGKIVRATVALARELGLRTVAEGIDTEEKADLLHRIGCDIGQGWLFGKAIDATQLEQQLAGERACVSDGVP